MTTTIPAFIAAQVPSGILRVDNQDWMRNAKGHLVPLANVSPADQLKDEMVREQLGFALALQAEIARFKANAFDRCEAFMDMLAQEYGMISAEGAKGNKTFATVDQLLKIEIRVADRVTFDEKLLIAKAKIDQCIRRWTTDPKQPANPNILALINYAFEVDKAGKVSPTRIASLRRLAIEDAEWREAMRAIDESRDVQESVEYITFHRRASTKEKWSLVTIDLAAARLTPEAIAMGGLRAEVARNETAFAAIQSAFTRIPDFPTTDPVNGVQHLVDWVLGLDPDADADDQAGVPDFLSDDTPFHHVVAEGIALRFDLRTLPVSRRLSAIVYLADSARDLLRDLYAGNGIDAIVSGADQNAIADAVDSLNDIHITLSEVIGRVRNTTAQAAE